MNDKFNLLALPLVIGTLWGGEQAINPQSAEACGLESPITKKPTEQKASNAVNFQSQIDMVRCPGRNRSVVSTNGVFRIVGKDCTPEVDYLGKGVYTGTEVLTTLGKECLDVKSAFIKIEKPKVKVPRTISIPSFRSKLQQERAADCYTFSSGEQLFCTLNDFSQLLVNKNGIEYHLYINRNGSKDPTKFDGNDREQMTPEDVLIIKKMDEQYRLEQPKQQKQFLEEQLAKYGKNTNETIDGNKTFVIGAEYDEYILYVGKNDKIVIIRARDRIKVNSLQLRQSKIIPELRSAIEDIETKYFRQTPGSYDGSCFE